MPEGPSSDTVKSLLERGRDLHRSGRLEEAEAVYGDVLRGSPDEFDALYAVAIIAAQKGRLDRAEELIAKALAVSPDHAEAQFNRGGLLFHLKRLDEALESFDSVVALEPGFAPAHFSRGLVLHRLGRAEQALESYDRSIGLAPDLAEAYLERANAQKDLGRFDDALASIDAFIGRKPGQAVAHNNRANLLKELGRDQEALADYDRAIALAPDDASAHYNRGNLLKDLDRPEEALEAYDRVIELNPDDPMTHNNRGNVLRELMRPDDAVASYRRAIALDPDHVQAHYNLSHCCLAMGDYATGWKEYEWRWREAQQAHRRRDFEQPLWLGGDGLEGKTILLHAEQGLGDTLQFCRYAKSVADRGARVLLEVPGPLMGVLGGLDGPDRLIAKGEPLPAFDCHCPLLSLPLAFATTVETIPAPRTYIAADPDRVAAWRDRLGAKDMPRVGLAWRGNPENGSDSSRSMGLALMSRLCT
ncbi:MAG: tetratricopeptide repeat protein, partial [Alphaproteobacteria bacterium]|nr:tetratricopeptide repeat protein [Alphaproteobacteria bacterium]